MKECTDLTKARKMHNKDGYVMIRGLIPREDILKARQEILKRLKKLKRIENTNDTTIINGKHG